jgi:hypothetical protein
VHSWYVGNVIDEIIFEFLNGLCAFYTDGLFLNGKNK